MDEYTATEMAYKNGYQKGVQDLMKDFEDLMLNNRGRINSYDLEEIYDKYKLERGVYAQEEEEVSR